MPNSPAVNTLIDALISLFSVGVGYAAYHFRKLLKRKKVRRIEGGIQAIHRANEILRRLAIRTGGERALLLKAHNGGNNPRPGHSLYVTIVNEWAGASLPSIRSEWIGRMIDGDYERVLAHILQDPSHRYQYVLSTTHDDSQVTQLQDAYRSQDISHSEIWLVGTCTKDKAVYYLSVQYVGTPPDDSANLRSDFKRAIIGLRQMLRVDDSHTYASKGTQELAEEEFDQDPSNLFWT